MNENSYSALIVVDPESELIEKILIPSSDDEAEATIRRALENFIFPSCEFCIQKVLIED